MFPIASFSLYKWFLKVWFLGDQASESPGTCYKYKFWGSIPDQLNQKTWQKDPSIWVLTILPDDSDTNSTLRTTALCTTNYKQKCNCPSTGEWINKLWCIHGIMKYYSAISFKILMQLTIWINLQIIMLRPRSQIQKTIYCVVLFI